MKYWSMDDPPILLLLSCRSIGNSIKFLSCDQLTIELPRSNEQQHVPPHRCLCLPTAFHLFPSLPVPPHRLPSLPTAACASPPHSISSHRCLCPFTASPLFLPLPVLPHRLPSLPTAACASPPPPITSHRCLCLPTASQLIMLLHRADNS